MFETLDSESRQVEKQSAAWKERILKFGGIVAVVLSVFGILYAGMLMIE